MAKVKIPKRIGGMKVPKRVRKTAKKALKRAGAASERAEQAVKKQVGVAFRAAAVGSLRLALKGFRDQLRNVGRPLDETERR